MEEITATVTLLIASAVIAISAANEPPSLTPADKAIIIKLEQETKKKEEETLQAYEQADFDFMHGVVYEPMSESEKEKHHAKQ